MSGRRKAHCLEKQNKEMDSLKCTNKKRERWYCYRLTSAIDLKNLTQRRGSIQTTRPTHAAVTGSFVILHGQHIPK